MAQDVQQTPDWKDQVAQSASDLIEALKQAAPQVTEAVVKYTWAVGLTGVLIAGFFLLFSLLCWSASVTSMLNKNMPTDDRAACIILGGIAGSIFGIISLMAIGSYLPMVLAPEGATIFKLLRAANGG